MIRRLLPPEPELLNDPSPRLIGTTAAITFAGLAIYGFTVGCWRSWEMGVYVAVKMPLMVACTLLCNVLLNGMLGVLLGGLGFRQSWQALLGAFAMIALILASLAPVTLFIALQFPDPDSPEARTAHAIHQIYHIALIAIAGVAGTLSLSRVLEKNCPSRGIARLTLAFWLLGNGLLGAQFSWIFRPFFGTPGLEVSFLRPSPMQGSFYDSTWKAVRRLGGLEFLGITLCIAVVILMLASFINTARRPSQPIHRN